jgi:hypothetical protein
MKKHIAIITFALVAAAPLTVSADPQPLSTDRYVHGVITSVETGALTIADAQHAITGRIDPARTKITVHGKPARLADLKVTEHAKAELCLDEVWVSIDEH